MIKIFVTLLLLTNAAFAARIKDIANVRGVRDNQLIGYGLVVGLNGTGDKGEEWTTKSMKRLLDSLGMKLEGADASSKNVAAVLVTANLPPFARSGNKIDITVNSIGSASSLAGGTLVQTPLRAANGQVFAVAQGSILVGGDGKAGSVGRISSGAIIEKDMDSDFATKKMFRVTLQNPDFTTAARLVQVINADLGGKYASAKDAATIDVVVPAAYEGNAVELLANVERLEVNPDTQAKVVVNEKTGTVVIGERVKISKIAISHGNISLKVEGAGEKGSKEKTDKGGDKIAVLESGANVGDLVKALSRLGVTPKDLITILQNIKASGALQAELEIL